jgi:crotonobetainyl-CoA:carnitine CoA-transferase CaiB-like acyl-CoA transferase
MKMLKGVKVLSLALNLPGPAALSRLRTLGAQCVKIEPPAATPAGSADPMKSYAPAAYEVLHDGIRIVVADLKTDKGRRKLAQELARTDVLLTSFRPAALRKLGLDWKTLHQEYPALSLVSIVGWPGTRADIPGHDLTYMAENDLLNGLALPPTLFADMAGALLASEAVLQALLQRQGQGQGTRHEVALAQAAAWLAQPRHWGLTMPRGAVGGAHAGYRVYACKDGRVAVAALEPHFAQALCAAAGLKASNMLAPATRKALASWFEQQTRRRLDALAQRLDLPLHTLARS